MKSSRPYLIRALYEWIVDNDCTPHLLVNSEHPKAQVPQTYAKDGQIVLNAAPSAVRYMHMDNEAVSFEARFGGVPFTLYVPTAAILAVYARENGQGMFFDQDELFDEVEDEVEQTAFEVVREVTEDDPTPDDEPPRPTGRPNLRVVK
ncbi:ClpXP protease specificity-enhancing factor [Pseudomonas sp. F1_0610]|uniref:ClpXP protease specificity-enhancing factor n=1 Tax=Pseudomonas sp. F1_0610 TaxID=3114284 RepID=UPI0039C12F2E